MATATSSVIKPDHGARRASTSSSPTSTRSCASRCVAWVLKELTPHRFEYEENLWPDSVLKRAGELGFIGLCYPEEYGGQGGDYFYSLVRADA